MQAYETAPVTYAAPQPAYTYAAPTTVLKQPQVAYVAWLPLRGIWGWVLWGVWGSFGCVFE